MSKLHVPLSKVKGDALREAVLDRFGHDYDYREEVVGTENLKRAAELYEAKSGTGQSGQVPRVNLIRRAVEDLLSVAIGNIPACKMYAVRDVPTSVPEWERDMRLEALDSTERVMNAYIRTLLKKAEANDAEEYAVTRAGIFGFGPVYVGIDRSLSARKDPQIRAIMRRDKMTEADLDRLHMMAHRVEVKDLDSRYVWIEAGKKRVQDAYRVSFIEFESQSVLQERYSDTTLGDPDLIAPNRLGYKVDESNGTRAGSPDALTAVLTMYEIEEISKEREVEGPGGDEIWVPFTDVRMVKVVVAGGEVVEREITEGVPDDDSKFEAGPLRLPVVFYYLHESVDHPFGVSLPLMLEVLEEYINSLRTLVYKMAKKASSSQGVVIWEPNLAQGDIDEIEEALDEGGVARVKGNGKNVNDIRDIVMPLNLAAQPLNPAFLQAMDVGMGDFRLMSSTPDPGEFSSARTGAAARARIGQADRTKGLTVVTLSRSKEEFYETVTDLIRTYHTDRVEVAVDMPGGGRVSVALNDPYRKLVVIQDDALRGEDNMMGLDVKVFETVLAATDTELYAEADGRGNLPLDMISRVQLLFGMTQIGAIMPETMRALGLDEDVLEIDDMNRRKAEAKMAEQQAAQMMAAQATGGMGDPSMGGPAGGPPMPPGMGGPPPGMMGGQPPSAGGSMMGDVQSDFAEGPGSMMS